MQAENELVVIARKILNGEIGSIAGARALAEYRDYFLLHDTKLAYADVAVFFEIDREVKHLPVSEEARRTWSPNALQEKDAEIEAVERKYQAAVAERCQRIIQKLSGA